MTIELLITERTPLRVNNRSVEVESEMSDNSSVPKPEMDDTKRIILKFVIDFVALLLVGLPILAFFIWGNPYERGFFCDDESLMHPFHESTVKNYYLYIVGLILPIILIIVTETIQTKVNRLNSLRNLNVFGRSIPNWIPNAYKQVGVFGFGAAASQLATDIGKYTIGRLRPHFIDVCQPQMMDGTNCSNPINIGRYIEDFTCLGIGSNTRMLKEMRLSFPSGHASFSAYTMIYCAIYLQARMTWRGSKLLKHFIQFVLVLLSWYTCMTRISDYKHHWSDVLAGATLGTFCALIVSNFVANLFVDKQQRLLPERNYEIKTSP
ncbi:putative phosphatidate phosphatase [Bradysia coprophila]|uniref:putative phosphatidate phosphatase n=1 Tax=Bradysia coprophila TaxID=38358 RepID=UPI00187D81D6|nr:putative phosphatidate phosphatase [Bradysia coprophila]